MNRVFLLLLEQQLVACCSHSWAAPALEAPRGRNGEGGLRKNVVTLHGSEEGGGARPGPPRLRGQPVELLGCLPQHLEFSSCPQEPTLR